MGESPKKGRVTQEGGNLTQRTQNEKGGNP